MSRLAAKDSHEKRSFKPQTYKSRGLNRCYNQGSFQNWPDSRNRGQYTSSRPRQNYRDGNFRKNTRGYSRQNNREDIEMIGIVITKEGRTDQEKGHS